MSEWQIAVIGGLLATIAYAAVSIMKRLTELQRSNERLAEMIRLQVKLSADDVQFAIRQAADSGAGVMLSESKRLKEAREWAEFTAWADAQKDRKPD